MKNHTLLSIFTFISLTATQCMPMAAVKSFFSKHMPTYEQAIKAIKSAPAVLATSVYKHKKTLTALALLSAATYALPQTRKALSQGARKGLRAIHSLFKRTREKASLDGQLLNAAKKGYPRIARILIAAKANISATNYNQQTPLHLAAKYGHLDVVRILLAAKADIAAQDDCNETPLHYAAKYGNLDIVNALLGAGADHCLRDYWGKTPLHWAIERQYFEIAKVLIGAGASTEEINLQASGYHAYIRSPACKSCKPA
jgi:ankyrin repeat protein